MNEEVMSSKNNQPSKLAEKERQKIVETRGLSKWFPMKASLGKAILRQPKEYIKAVNDVSLSVYRSENLGLVGESGCGKSTLARTIIRLYEPTEGEVFLDGEDISHIQGKELLSKRRKMQMIFQDPYSSLNPRMTVYEMLAEMLKFHKIVPPNQMKDRIEELLVMCGMSMDIADRFPGEFSGGQRQRLGIARALSLNPKLIIADEPVSALDVSIQAQIINLLDDLQQSLNLSVLFISHDLGVVQHVTHTVAVMYLGSIVEMGDSGSLFENPAHPYTLVLAKAAPVLNPLNRTRDYAIEGEPPSPVNLPSGCAFHPRCTHCQDICRQETPRLRETAAGRQVACHFPLYSP